MGSSHLDEVLIDNPKELFRRFSRYGTLAWQDLHDMCDGEISRDLMALKFSHTFPLNSPVPAVRGTESVQRRRHRVVFTRTEKVNIEHVPQTVRIRVPGAAMSTSSTPLLLSLKPRYADLVFGGRKRVELRRRSLKRMRGRDAFVYATTPVRMLRGGFRIGKVWTGTPEEIWSVVSDDVGVEKPEFDAYYAGRELASALEVYGCLGVRASRGTQCVERQTAEFRRAAIMAVRKA